MPLLNREIFPQKQLQLCPRHPPLSLFTSSLVGVLLGSERKAEKKSTHPARLPKKSMICRRNYCCMETIPHEERLKLTLCCQNVWWAIKLESTNVFSCSTLLCVPQFKVSRQQQFLIVTTIDFSQCHYL
jgi:hypothetical protein